VRLRDHRMRVLGTLLSVCETRAKSSSVGVSISGSVVDGGAGAGGAGICGAGTCGAGTPVKVVLQVEQEAAPPSEVHERHRVVYPPSEQ